MRKLLLVLAVCALAGSAVAGQVPNPVNAPASIGSSGDALIASGTKAQQAADSGISLTSQNANQVLAGPTSGGAAAPGFRGLVTADLPAGVGTVTSVALTLPTAFFNISGSPVTSAGTLAVSLQDQGPNTIWAGPTNPGGGAATPSFRALVAADTQSQITVVGSLPTCNSGSEGQRYGVIDASAPSPLASVAGGGGSHVGVYCNGSAWIVE